MNEEQQNDGQVLEKQVHCGTNRDEINFVVI